MLDKYKIELIKVRVESKRAYGSNCERQVFLHDVPALINEIEDLRAINEHLWESLMVIDNTTVEVMNKIRMAIETYGKTYGKENGRWTLC